MVQHRNRAILFGGTTDQKGRGEKVYSELHNELFQFSFDRQRWYPVLLKAPKQQQQQQQDGASNDASGLRSVMLHLPMPKVCIAYLWTPFLVSSQPSVVEMGNRLTL